MDRGNRDFDRVTSIHVSWRSGEAHKARQWDPPSAETLVVSQSGYPEVPSDITCEVNYINQSVYRGNYRRPWETGRKKVRTASNACFACGEQGNFARFCTKKRCLKCGRPGHDARNCRSGKILTIESEQTKPPTGVRESGVLISMKVNGRQVTGMLDSGAQLSVVDQVSLVNMEIGYTQSQGAGARTGFQSCRDLWWSIDVGDGQRVSQELQMLASDYPILILGRDFLRKFHQTEFDWDNYRIRLGDSWEETKANTRGGSAISRATVAQYNVTGG